MKVPKAQRLPSGSWHIQLRLGGESVPVTGRTEKEVTTAARLIKAEYLAGKRAPKADPLAEDLTTLSQLFDAYVAARKATASPSTLRGYRTIQRNRFPSLMDRPLASITEEEWKAAYNEEAGTVAAKTLKNAWGLIGSVLKEAHRPPLPEVLEPQVVSEVTKYLSYQEIRKFVSATDGDSYQIPMLLALSSLRRSEIFALDWKQIDLKKGMIHVEGAVVPGEDHKMVRKQTNKNQTSRRNVPIFIPELKAALKAVPDKTGPVVNARPDTLVKRVKKTCVKAKVTEVTPHGLRHSFASLAYHLQMPEKVCMEIGGWSDPATMEKIYTHIAQDDIDHYGKELAKFYGSGKKPAKNAYKNAYKNSGAP